VRKRQLDFLSKLAQGDGPLIVAGDFNTFEGPKEIADFQRRLGLCNPNLEGLCTYPSWAPNRQLDFILCSEEIRILNFEVPEVKFSDHLPVLLDFYVEPGPSTMTQPIAKTAPKIKPVKKPGRQ